MLKLELGGGERLRRVVVGARGVVGVVRAVVGGEGGGGVADVLQPHGHARDLGRGGGRERGKGG